MTIEIVDFPIKHGDFPEFFDVFCMFTRPGNNQKPDQADHLDPAIWMFSGPLGFLITVLEQSFVPRRDQMPTKNVWRGVRCTCYHRPV